MDIAPLFNYGVPTIILLLGGYAAGKFIEKRWDVIWTWFSETYMPHKMEQDKQQSELLTELKLLQQQSVQMLFSISSDIEKLAK